MATDLVDWEFWKTVQVVMISIDQSVAGEGSANYSRCLVDVK
jgi:hypothetical protein